MLDEHRQGLSSIDFPSSSGEVGTKQKVVAAARGTISKFVCRETLVAPPSFSCLDSWDATPVEHTLALLFGVAAPRDPRRMDLRNDLPRCGIGSQWRALAASTSPGFPAARDLTSIRTV